MKAENRIRPSEITSETNYLRRREFLRDAGLAVGGAAAALALPRGVAAKARELDTVPGPYSTDESPNSWEDVTTYNNFYEFGTGKEDPFPFPANAENRATTLTKTSSARTRWKTGSIATDAWRPGQWLFPGSDFHWAIC